MSSTDPERRGLRALLWPHVRPRLPSLLAALGIALLIAIMGAAQPLLTRFIIDRGLIARDYRDLLLGCGAMLALAALISLAGAAHRRIYVRASGRTLFALRGEVYEHLLRVAPRRLQQVPVGDLVCRLDADIAEVQRFGTDALAAAISSMLALAAVGAAMLGLSWRLAALVAALLPLQLLVRHVGRGPLERTTRALRTSAGELSAYLVETLGAARQVQAAAAERYESGRLAGLGERYLARVLDQQWVTYTVGSLSGLLSHATTAAVFALGGWYVLEGRLSVGTLVAFVAYLGRSSGSAASLAGLYVGYQRARVSLGRVEELLELPRLAEVPRAAPLSGDARGTVRFDAVTVRAADNESPAVLEAVTLEIPAGTKVILQGVSGAGKSTLVDCLRRFIDPDGGEIRIDGRPLREYRLGDIRRRVAVVEHAPLLFSGSILDNLRYGNDEVNEEQVVEAARRVGADAFIRELPRGYATPVGEKGATLSTGQRQRLAIARALLANPLIVVLDEATSGLDIEATCDLHQALDDAFEKRTRIIVTHRRGEIERADLVLVLENGRVRPAAANVL